MTWHIRGAYIEFCSCDPGCGCNFRGFPSSPEGNCFALLGGTIDDGRSDDLDLAGVRWAWALWWPGAIHDRGGSGHVYFDCGSDEQFGELRRIWRGEAGHPYFEIFNSTFNEPTAAERAPVEVVVDGKSSRLAVDGTAVGRMEPLRNPVSGEDNDVRIVKPGGFIWKDGQIAQGTEMRVQLPEMSFDVSGRHAVFSNADWSA
jgi:hypothetical protein